MRRLSVLGAILLVICLQGIGAQSGGESPAAPASPAPAATGETALPSKVFAVNLWSSPIDLQLGADGVFVTANLSANSASQMVVFSNPGARALQYRSDSKAAWQENKQANGNTLYYDLKGGKIYLILVQTNGLPGLYELRASDKTGPKLAVINASGYNLPFLQVGSGFNQGIVAAAKDLSPSWTDFVDIPPGNFGAFWSYPTMPDGIAYYFSAGRDGTSLGLTSMADKGWYVLIIWHDGASKKSGGAVWDVGPR